MIDIRQPEDAHRPLVIEARSNMSISLDRLAAVFLGLSAVTLLVALGPALYGYWPIMLAAVLHLVVVGWCMRLGWRGHWARERLAIDRDTLAIDHYDARRRDHSEWPTPWVRVTVESERLGDRQVYVTCHGKRQAIGSFLSPDERLELAELLKRSLRPFDARS